MKLVEINWQPTNRQLRQFGLTCLVALPVLGWIGDANTAVITILAAIGLALGIVGLALPVMLKPLFVLMSIVAAPIGVVIGELVMLVIYFGVFLMFGLLFRMTGRDLLQLKLDRSSRSYWQKKQQPANTASYYRQS